jgi:hypothetical protein
MLSEVRRRRTPFKEKAHRLVGSHGGKSRWGKSVCRLLQFLEAAARVQLGGTPCSGRWQTGSMTSREIRVSRATVMIAVLLICGVPTARAEVASPRAVAEAASATPEFRLAAPDPELWRSSRRARVLLALGVAFAVSAAIHVGWAAPTRTCGYGHQMNTSLYAAGVLGGLGTALTITGATMLRRRPERLPPSPGQLGGILGGAVGAAFGVQAVLAALRALDSPGCST